MFKNNKGSILPTILVIFYIFIFLSPLIFELLAYIEDEGIILNPNDYVKITDIEYKALLVDDPEERSKMIINERITFDIHAASRNNLFWELWRDLPEDTVDGLPIRYNVNYVKQILPNGEEIVYSESPKLYWDDSDYLKSNTRYGPGKWFHSDGYENRGDGDYECLMLYIDGTYRDKLTFEIEYEMTNPALKYKDASELYLCMYSGHTVNYLESFKGQIIIPEEDMPDKGNYFAHTYGTDANEFPFIESDTLYKGYHTFSFELDKNDLKFSPYNQYIEFALVSYGTDKHIFTNYAPNNRYTFENYLDEAISEQEKYENTAKNFQRIKMIILLGCIVLTYRLYEKVKKTKTELHEKYNFYEPDINYDYFREIPSNLDPCFAADLAFIKNKPKKIKPDGYSAVLLSLVRKKYVSLEKIYENGQWNHSNVRIKVNYIPKDSVEVVEDFIGDYDGYEPLSLSEQTYFNMINKYTVNNEISLLKLNHLVSSDYDNAYTFVNSLESSAITVGISEGYLQKLVYDEPKTKLIQQANGYKFWGWVLILINIITYFTRLDLVFGGFIIYGLSFFVSAHYVKKIADGAILLTQSGENEHAKWRGLYNFLNSDTLMNERTVIELPLWEQYLVYATAFGISEHVIKAINLRCPEFTESDSALSNPYYRSRSFYSSSHSFRSSARTGYNISRSSSYGSYGGGCWSYGGGGRGGGGGGGGH